MHEIIRGVRVLYPVYTNKRQSKQYGHWKVEGAEYKISAKDLTLKYSYEGQQSNYGGFLSNMCCAR